MDKNDMKFSYDPDDEPLREAVYVALATYLRICRMFPKVIYIPAIEAGYKNSIMETRIDPNLTRGVIWLGR